MREPIILSTGPVIDSFKQKIEKFGKLIILNNPTDEEIIKLIPDAIVYIVRGDGRATKEIIEAGKNLKVIGRTGVGVESVDIYSSTKNWIPLINTPGANARSVAEASIALIFALAKNLMLLNRELLNLNWNIRHKAKPLEIENTTVGIIGFGQIGRELASLLTPLNFNVQFYDPFVGVNDVIKYNAKKVDIEELIATSDFICLHVGLNESTKNLVDKKFISKMKNGSYLINLARGGLIEDLSDLQQALESEKLSGVALDVFKEEPVTELHPIFLNPRCITTPHAVGMSDGAISKSFNMLYDDIEKILMGKSPKHLVNKELLDVLWNKKENEKYEG